MLKGGRSGKQQRLLQSEDDVIQYISANLPRVALLSGFIGFN